MRNESKGGAGETFELVVTAAQNFGGERPPPPIQSGRPHVIPVDIDHIRGGGDAPIGDEFVSIDTRKTYFNLFPTNAGPSTPVIAPTATITSYVNLFSIFQNNFLPIIVTCFMVTGKSFGWLWQLRN